MMPAAYKKYNKEKKRVMKNNYLRFIPVSNKVNSL